MPVSMSSPYSPCRPATSLTTLENVTLSAHSAFRTPEASDNLIGAVLDHCRRIAASRR
jgi:D-3-phosphoglycerate dehydrogenase